MMALRLAVDLGDQRAGGIEIEHVARLAPRPAPTLARRGRRRPPAGPVSGHLVELLDEDRALALQAVDHVAVVDDLVADIDRRAPFLQRHLDDLDRPVDTGAKAARRAQHDSEGWPVGGHGPTKGSRRRDVKKTAKVGAPDVACLGVIGIVMKQGLGHFEEFARQRLHRVVIVG